MPFRWWIVPKKACRLSANHQARRKWDSRVVRKMLHKRNPGNWQGKWQSSINNLQSRIEIQRVRCCTHEEPSKTMAKMLLEAQKYMNAEDTLAAIGNEDKPIEREGKREDRRGQKRDRGDRQETNEKKWRDKKTPRTIKFTPLIMPIDKIWSKLRITITLNGRSHCTHRLVCETKGSTATSTKTMAITLKTARTWRNRLKNSSKKGISRNL